MAAPISATLMIDRRRMNGDMKIAVRATDTSSMVTSTPVDCWVKPISSIKRPIWKGEVLALITPNNEPIPIATTNLRNLVLLVTSITQGGEYLQSLIRANPLLMALSSKEFHGPGVSESVA